MRVMSQEGRRLHVNDCSNETSPVPSNGNTMETKLLHIAFCECLHEEPCALIAQARFCEVAANKIFELAGESPVLAIYPFQPSRHIRHTEW